MAQVSLPYTLTAGTPENVNNLVANLNALVAGVNTIDTAQIASSAVTTAKIADANVTTAKIADGNVTADKLSAAAAASVGLNQTGVTNRAAMTAMTTERSTTSTSWTDVTGASLTFTVASGAYVIVGYNAQVKASSGNCYWKVLADTAVCNVSSSQNPGAVTGFVDGTQTSYVKVGGMAMFSAAEIGTGSKTFKWQFATYGVSGTPTAYIDEAYLTVTQVTF